MSRASPTEVRATSRLTVERLARRAPRGRDRIDSRAERDDPADDRADGIDVSEASDGLPQGFLVIVEIPRRDQIENGTGSCAVILIPEPSFSAATSTGTSSPRERALAMPSRVSPAGV